MFDRIYGIYDLKARAVVGPLLLIPSDGAAGRMFCDVIHGNAGQVSQHPEDYVLVYFGDLTGADDDVLGLRIQPVVRPLDEPVLSGVAVLAADEDAARKRRREELERERDEKVAEALGIQLAE